MYAYISYLEFDERSASKLQVISCFFIKLFQVFTLRKPTTDVLGLSQKH
jgi:hypothetical protein